MQIDLVQIDLTQIVVALIGTLAAIITRYVIPLIKAKIDAGKLEKISFWVKIAVEAAEKIYKEPGMGEQKKEFVIDFLNQHDILLDEQQVDVMIEAAVLQMQNALSNK